MTLKSKLVAVPSKRVVDYIVNKLFEVVEFEGRPYLLRHFANKRLKAAYEDKDFKEWCMGHKGDISDIYDHGHGLSFEEIREYNASIDMSRLRIYGATVDEMKNAKLMLSVVKKLPYSNTEQLDKTLKQLETGKLSFEQFDQKLTLIIEDTQNQVIEKRFAELMEQYNNRNGKSGH